MLTDAPILSGVILTVVSELPLYEAAWVPLVFITNALCAWSLVAAPTLLAVILTILLALPLKVVNWVPFPCIVKVPVVLFALVAAPPALEDPAYLWVWLVLDFLFNSPVVSSGTLLIFFNKSSIFLLFNIHTKY